MVTRADETTQMGMKSLREEREGLYETGPKVNCRGNKKLSKGRSALHRSGQAKQRATAALS